MKKLSQLGPRGPHLDRHAARRLDTVDRLLGDDVVVKVGSDSDVGGRLLGARATVVAGVGPWFVMADANYNYSDIDEFVGGISAWFLSARTGWSGPLNWGSWKAWAGVAYLDADRTITMQAESAILGTVTVDVDQRPVNPTTLQAGGSIGIGRKWDVMVEIGSNFYDAFVGVFSARLPVLTRRHRCYSSPPSFVVHPGPGAHTVVMPKLNP